MTFNQLALLTQDRLEEPPDGVGIFWLVQDEIYPLLQEACNEATLITGLPQVRSGELFTLTANTRIFTLPNNGIVLMRMDGPGTVAKTSAWALDQNDHEWEEDTGPVPLRWFPLGIGQFGIWPLLTADSQVFLTSINLPVPVARPFTGNEVVPFSVEFQEAIVDYASSVARLKEAGQDAFNGLAFYQMFLSKMGELSKFGDRVSKLRFTRSGGVPAQTTDTEVR